MSRSVITYIPLGISNHVHETLFQPCDYSLHHRRVGVNPAWIPTMEVYQTDMIQSRASPGSVVGAGVSGCHELIFPGDRVKTK